jgi:hypothetical protein
LSKQVAPLLKEWADVVLFANFVTKIAEKDNGKLRGVGGKERVLFANHAAAYDAKNRHGLPDKLAFSIDALTPVFGDVAERAVAHVPHDKLATKSIAERIVEAFGDRIADVTDFLIARGQISYDSEGEVESFDKLDSAYAERMLSEPERFLAAVQEWAKEEVTK